LARPTIIAGNWKHNPDRIPGESLFREISEGTMSRFTVDGGDSPVRVVLFPPSPWLGWFASNSSEFDRSAVEIGVQEVSDRPLGAFTGEVGAQLAQQFGAEWALVGHSERRSIFGETDQQAASRVKAAATAGLRPILCIGETLEQREAGETFEVVSRQLETGLSKLDEEFEYALAYEPVWAIGTGRTATTQQVEEVHRHLREVLRRARGASADEVPILYGGSVKPDNAQALLGIDGVDGALVGGASLSSASFLGILDAGIATA
jgi:triosephosphate isomerase